MKRLVLLVLASLLACGDDAPTVDRTPGVAPTDTRFELRVVGGDRTLRGLAEPFGPEVDGLFATTVLDVIERALALPAPVRERVRGDGELRVLATDGADGLDFAFAVPFDARGFETLEAGGPRGTWRPGGAANLALVPATPDSSATLVAATTAEALTEALPYLAFARFEPLPAGLHVRFPGRRFAEDLRPVLARSAREQLQRARQSLAAERARRDEAPPLGDPEVVLARVEAFVDRLVGHVSDLGPTELTFTHDATGVHLRLRSTLEDSPTRDALAAWSASPLDATQVPQGSALAIAVPSIELAPLVEAMAGERLDADARESLASFARAWPEGARTVALGRSEAGRFVRARAVDAPGDEVVAPLVEAPFVRAWAERLADGAPLRLHSRELALGDAPTSSLADDPDLARLWRGPARFALYADAFAVAGWLAPDAPRRDGSGVVLRMQGGNDAIEITIDAPADALPPWVALLSGL
ncbi:MAG: hypothetical protein H6722_24560 [Sandaracinus sp.]|nr:hypothetical protein [Sandaracinus sp.]